MLFYDVIHTNPCHFQFLINVLRVINWKKYYWSLLIEFSISPKYKINPEKVSVTGRHYIIKNYKKKLTSWRGKSSTWLVPVPECLCPRPERIQTWTQVEKKKNCFKRRRLEILSQVYLRSKESKQVLFHTSRPLDRLQLQILSRRLSNRREREELNLSSFKEPPTLTSLATVRIISRLPLV